MTAPEPAIVAGIPLSTQDYAALESRWITVQFADGALLRRVDSLTGADLTGQHRAGDYAGILIPYFWPGEPHVRDYRLRRDHPDLEQDGSGAVRPKRKYVAPPGRSNLLYFPVGTDPALLSTANTPIIIVEGEFKSMALWRLAWESAADGSPAFLPIGLSGVWNWRGTVGKTSDADGHRTDVKGPIPDLSRINWVARSVTILFDADLENNLSVRDARRQLTIELEQRGAIVSHFRWPDGVPPALKGIDDYLAATGPSEALKLLAKAKMVTKRRQAATVTELPAPTDWRGLLLRNEDGQPRPLLANAMCALRHAPEWEGVIAFNDFSSQPVTVKPTPWNPRPHVWTDHEDILLAEWLQLQGIRVTRTTAGEAVEAVARERSIHPVRDYLTCLTWDGEHRLDAWLTTYLGVRTDADLAPYVRAVGARWMISAVARIMQPACKADCCLILEGPQGIKKTTALRVLAGDENFTDQVAGLGTKDASLQVAGVWIVELAELDALGRAEVETVKKFLTQTDDRIRLPYGKRVSRLSRQCVFGGTVNKSEYLKDESGARRFWPVRCTSVDIEALIRDRDQLWAEAVARYLAGEHWWLDSRELEAAAATEQRDRYQSDAWESAIADYVYGRTSVTVAEVLGACLSIPLAKQGQIEANRVARVLCTLGWAKHRTGGRESRGYCYMPMGG